MYKDSEQEKRRTAHLEKAMYSAWLKESGESGDEWVSHLRECVQVAMNECLTQKQSEYLSLYLSGYSVGEIAEMCDVATSTESRTMSRGLNKITERIKYATPRTLHAAKRVKKKLTGIYK